MRHHELLKSYEQGAVTRTELFTLMMADVREGTQEDRDFILSLDEAWTASLKQYLWCRPHTEEEWGQLRTFAIAAEDRRFDPELARSLDREETRMIRRGVEFCRSVLAARRMEE